MGGAEGSQEIGVTQRCSRDDGREPGKSGKLDSCRMCLLIIDIDMKMRLLTILSHRTRTSEDHHRFPCVFSEATLLPWWEQLCTAIGVLIEQAKSARGKAERDGGSLVNGDVTRNLCHLIIHMIGL